MVFSTRRNDFSLLINNDLLYTLLVPHLLLSCLSLVYRKLIFLTVFLDVPVLFFVVNTNEGFCLRHQSKIVHVSFGAAFFVFCVLVTRDLAARDCFHLFSFLDLNKSFYICIIANCALELCSFWVRGTNIITTELLNSPSSSACQSFFVFENKFNFLDLFWNLQTI